jgi:hypothetical protein
MISSGITPPQALLWTERLIALALIQQSVELFLIRHEFGVNGVWSWQVLKRDFMVFPPWVRALLDGVLGDRIFLGVVMLQMLLGAWGLFSSSPGVLFGLWLTCTLICLRWRGTFNGGSDFMTLVVLNGLVLACIFRRHPGALKFALVYIAFHSVLSYWRAGLAKIVQSNWRSGKALRYFLTVPHSEWKNLPALRTPWVVLFLTWMVLLFECSFPLALLSPQTCFFYLGLGLCFHIGNAVVLGLNRFILPWCATYPALYFISERVVEWSANW